MSQNDDTRPSMPGLGQTPPRSAGSFTDAADAQAVNQRGADPGSKEAGWIAWVLGLGLLAALVFINFHEGRAQSVGPAASGEPAPPDFSDPFTLNSKMLVKLSYAMPTDPASQAMIASQIEAAVENTADRLRVVMIEADLSGDEAGLAKLEKMRTAVEEERDDAEVLKPLPDWWTEDALRLEAVLATGETGASENLEALKERHGWFADVLATRDSEMSDPARADAVGGGLALIGVIALAGLVGFVAFVGGIIAGIRVLLGLSKRAFVPAFVPPLPGGSVYLETIVAFLAGFLALKLVLPAVLAQTGALSGTQPLPEWATAAQLALQWLLLPLIFWPLLRGVSWQRWRTDIGWHSGAGVWKEVWAGVYAYFGGLPLLAVAALITIVIVVARGLMQSASGAEPVPPKNPIVDLLQNSSPLTIVMLFTLATIWAPIVEETLFRGGVFRHMRARMGVLVSALLSAVWFGLMHSYEIPLLLPVITLGFVFALMREWRGSLIGSVVAHGLHNATVLTLAIAFFSALG